MKKLIIIAVIVLLIIGTGYFLLAPVSATAAVLYVERGQVEVNSGSGWQIGTDEMELSKGSQVKTGDGEATVVLLEGEVVHLEPNSEIKLDQISGKKIHITQLAGETWNKVTKISGISEFTIETPTTVATVRGTEFILNEEELDVSEGEVDYGLKAGEKIKVMGGKRALAKMLREENIPEERLARIRNFPEKYEKILKRVRAREIRKHEQILRMAEKRGFTEEKIRAQLNEIDEGRQDEEKAYEQVPALMKPKAKRTYLLTKEIKRARMKLRDRLITERDAMRELETQRDIANQ
ncbi:MAG TPA: FecR family protein [Candidatus Nanoarchaeia archaeon]|nr:FecR family protein [Candidatus Nanoarchaeia archaeon]